VRHRSGAIGVYGANGHTGRFVVDELTRRDLPVVGIARDVSRLPDGMPVRQAGLDDPDALTRALEGCAVVINCAGPFLDTARPVIEAALRAGACYLDVTAEQGSARATLEEYDQRAREAGVAVIPAAGFYGGMADLLATVLIGQRVVQETTVAVALDHWWPTAGTRITGARNRLPRMVVENHQLVPMGQPPRNAIWTFDAPFGEQNMVELGFSEIVSIARHLRTRALHSWLNVDALADVRDESTPPPTAVDAQGRSAQKFMIDVVVEDAAGIRKAGASGQDIYAVSAPVVVEAAQRLLDPASRPQGTLTLGQAFDAREFLLALAPHVEARL
jgi:hypothetical protein